MADFILGMNAKIYQGPTDTVLGSLTEMSNVRDVTLNMEAGEADYTTRANSGWRAVAPTLREMSVDFEMVWKTDDDGFVAIRDAYLSNDTIELAILDQAKTESGAQGPLGSFSITSFSRGEPLEEVITVSVSAKLADYKEWVEV